LKEITFSGDDDNYQLTMSDAAIEANFSLKRLGRTGMQIITAFLPKCT
jgi:hypothetical protein